MEVLILDLSLYLRISPPVFIFTIRIHYSEISRAVDDFFSLPFPNIIIFILRRRTLRDDNSYSNNFDITQPKNINVLHALRGIIHKQMVF